MKNSYLLLLIFVLFAGCKKEKSRPSNDYFSGSVTVFTDDSFKSVTEALADAYMISYPKAKISVKVQKEDLSLLDLLRDKARLIVMSRDLSPAEISEYKRITDLEYQPARFAADAVIFVVPKNSTRTSISMDEIKAMLNDKSKPLIFDGTNSGNLNFVAQKFGKKPADLQFSVISGNENVINQIKDFPDKVGVVSQNTLSRAYNSKTETLREQVKVLPVVEGGKVIDVSEQNVQKMVYPFTRILYFVTREGNFQIANGFIRFSCTQIGQMVVEKEGLQPYNLYKREVQMH